MPDLSKDFDKEVASWTRGKRIEAALLVAQAVLMVCALAFLTWMFQYVFFGFFLTRF